MSDQTEAPLAMLVIQEMQLLLAEKRTALSTLRTGIAIFAFPLSVLSVLIVTSKNYELHAVMHWLLPMMVINFGLIGLAVYLIVRGLGNGRLSRRQRGDAEVGNAEAGLRRRQYRLAWAQ